MFETSKVNAMIAFAHSGPHGERAMRKFASGTRIMVGALALSCAGPLWHAAGAQETVPNFSPDSNTGWLAPDDDFIKPPSGPGPVTFDPAHPYISFYKFPQNPHPAFRVADPTNPILQPWAADSLRKTNEKALSGSTVFTPKERCWPIGVPGFLLYPALPVYFLQMTRKW